MGAINYKTSDYITLAIEPLSGVADCLAIELADDARECNISIDEYVDDYISDYYDCNYRNANDVFSHYNFQYFNISIEPGYYEGLSINIQSNFVFCCDEDKRDALDEIEQMLKCLNELAGIGFIACYPGWCTRYFDYEEILKMIDSAIIEMRNDLRCAELEEV